MKSVAGIWNCIPLRLIFNVWTFVLVLCQSEYKLWLKVDYPNPSLEPSACGRINPSHICDPDRLMLSSEVNELDKVISNLKSANDCGCDDKSTCSRNSSYIEGFPLKIALLQNISIVTNLQDDGQEFADYLRRKWTLGTCDDSVVILFVEAYHKGFLSIGDDTVNGDRLKDLNEIMKVEHILLDGHRYFSELRRLVDDTVGLLNESKAATPTAAYRLSFLYITLLSLAAVFMVLLMLFIVYKKCIVKEAPSTSGLPWTGTRVKIFNLGLRKKQANSS
ncbi:Uncharacterised protein g3385 [Pycnogonum litorale]